MSDKEETADHDDERPHSDSVSGDARATDHPTGDKQAAENAENEPAG